MKKVTVPFFISHSGCPHHCVFCDQTKISGSPEQLPEQLEIAEKIREYRKTSRGKQLEVAFFGGSFTSLPETTQNYLLDPLQPLLHERKLDSIRISTRPDSVDASSSKFLKSRGVSTVELGVQSMDEEVLELSGRGHGYAHVEQAVSSLKKEGMTVGIQLMPGLPGDTEAKSMRSLRSVLDLDPDFLRIYPTLVIAGTALEKLYAEGSYSPMTLESAVRLCKIMLHQTLQANVPVIRMGLQATEDLQRDGIIVAGPYHVAFRQMVESELCFDLLKSLLQHSAAPGDAVTIECSPSRVSDVVGHKKANVKRLRHSRGVVVSKVRHDSALSPSELRVICGEAVSTGNILHDLNYEVVNV